MLLFEVCSASVLRIRSKTKSFTTCVGHCTIELIELTRSSSISLAEADASRTCTEVGIALLTAPVSLLNQVPQTDTNQVPQTDTNQVPQTDTNQVHLRQIRNIRLKYRYPTIIYIEVQL